MPTTKAHFAAMGRVAYEWSRLEMQLQGCIALVAGVPAEIGLILTNSGSVRTWTDTLARLVRHRRCSETICKRTEKLGEKIASKLYPARNTIIHGIWEMSWSELFGDNASPLPDHEAFVNALKKAGKHMHVGAKVTASDIEAVAEEIKNATLDVQKLSFDLHDALPDTPP